MGAKFWGVDIQTEIGGAIKPTDMPNFKLRKMNLDASQSPSLSDGPTYSGHTDYQCHGTISDYTTQDMLDSPLVQQGDKRIKLVGKSLADQGVEPQMDDLIVDGDKIYTIVNVRTNSAKAMWTLQCRG